MSIDRTQPATPANMIAQTQELRTRNLSQEASQKPHAQVAEDKTQVKLSTLTQQLKTDCSGDVDHERVASLRAAIEAGDLPVETQQIARALVQDIFQFI